MKLAIDPLLGLSAQQWQFLLAPDRYVCATKGSERELVSESTERQFKTARDILDRLKGSYGKKPIRGMLLADDVGLGKTTVAALVAWVFASSGQGRGVRILVPNDVMVRRWKEELLSHVEPLQKCATHLGVQKKQVKGDGRLRDGSIQVVKHSHASSGNTLKCDLLIVDEAHRAKGEGTAFSEALKQRKQHALRVLILTATPFSIRLEELERMLTLIGAESARGPVRKFSHVLDDLHDGNTARHSEIIAKRLMDRAKDACEALSPFVIRHSIDDLPHEQSSFGDRADWNINVPNASDKDIELMLRMDRARRLTKGEQSQSSNATNDSRFHVGWQHFDRVKEELKIDPQRLEKPVASVVAHHIQSMTELRKEVGRHHVKMIAVADEVERKVSKGEKVLLFCHHHATAQELTLHLNSVLPKVSALGLPHVSVWRNAWNDVLEPAGEAQKEEFLRKTFIDWLCAKLIRTQTWDWLGSAQRQDQSLADSLKTTNARKLGADSIAKAAQHLYHSLLQSKSSRAILKAVDALERLPGANTTSRVLGVCDPSDKPNETHLFHSHQPDTVISIFNSPFGPDVLVVTDKLSEGIDLHRYCRHLIHYELDPSPIRTVQRNGRLRRVNSWAAVTGQPILYAYPALRGTRDYKLVQIMKKRINSFSLLLGGVQEIKLDDGTKSDEHWRNEVIREARKRLESANRMLIAKEPKAAD